MLVRGSNVIQQDKRPMLDEGNKELEKRGLLHTIHIMPRCSCLTVDGLRESVS